MTLSADDTAGQPPISFHLAQPDDYDEAAVRCPLCGIRVDGAPGTPSIPTSHLVDDEIAVSLGDEVPAFGFVCERHREKVRLLAPAVIAPGNYVALDAEIDGVAVEIAVPEPVLEEVSARAE